MAILHQYAQKKDLYLIADAGWSLCIPINFYILYLTKSPNIHLSILMVFLNCIWGIRLTRLLWKRFQSGREDQRYINMKQAWGDTYPKKFFLFFMAQSLASWIFALPFYFSFHQKLLYPRLLIFGILIFFCGLSLSWLADQQVVWFKQNNKDPQGFCKQGLWKYSRHPNYFFEWVSWIGMAITSTAFAFGYFAWVTVAVELFLILYVSGIPYTQGVMLEKRKEAYRRYMQTTSLFIPWFPK